MSNWFGSMRREFSSMEEFLQYFPTEDVFRIELRWIKNKPDREMLWTLYLETKQHDITQEIWVYGKGTDLQDLHKSITQAVTG
jgi:uncharacterized protein (DUF1684 family)